MIPHSDPVLAWLGTIFFFSAVFHTFLVHKIKNFSHRFRENGVVHKILLFLGEVEIVFGFWTFLFLICLSAKFGMDASVQFLTQTNFSEVVFIFAMMCMSYTKPIIDLADIMIGFTSKIFSKIFFVHKKIALFYAIFVLGTLTGSLITEPVAMTVCAFLLYENFFKHSSNVHFKYAMLGLLFVNISIGGTLTIFSAPPVLMLAGPWNWTTSFLFGYFGWKTIVAVVISTVLCSVVFRSDIINSKKSDMHVRKNAPVPIMIINVFFLAASVMYHKYIAFVIPLFFLFLGFYEVTKEYQKNLKIRESLLVGFFIAGIVILGGLQNWWIAPLAQSTKFFTILFGTTFLTSVTDNVAVAYIASQIQNLPMNIKYAFLTGTVTGGGLTVIANAPNPIGYGILNKAFGEDGIKPNSLFLWALPPTGIAILSYLLL